MSVRPGRGFLLTLLGIVGVGALLRLAWLGSQAPTGDEVQVVWTASNYVLHGQPYPTMPFHPVLRSLLVFLSTQVLGSTALGTRAFSLLFGTLLVGVTGLFVRRVTTDDRAGLFAAGLVAIDIVMIELSRQAIQEVHAAFFVMLGAWLVVEALGGESRRWAWLLPLAGLSFGLGVASKFYAIPALVLSLLLLLRAAWQRRSSGEAVLAVVSLGPLAILVYLLTYAPWFTRGYDLSEWARFQWATIDSMLTHSKPAIGWMANSRPVLWFVRPFYAQADIALLPAGQQLSVAAGNPLVWLAVLPAAIHALIDSRQRRRDALLLAFFFASYAPLALSVRPVWMLSSTAVFPFAAGVLGSVVSSLTKRFGMRLALAYGGAVLVASLMLYPLAVGRALDFEYLRPVVAPLGEPMNATQTP